MFTDSLDRIDWKSYLSIILIVVSIFVVYKDLSTHEFLIVDDGIYVYNNQHVRTGLNSENIVWAFTTLDAEFWHPLTWISYMVDTEVFGNSPGGYLFTNLLIHTINSVLLFYLLKIASGKIWESCFIALLFALHPFHVEAVAWISERKELLCALFWISALIAYVCYVKNRSLIIYFIMSLLFIMGIMSKSMIITFPFLLLLFDLWPLNRWSSLNQTCHLIVEKIPLFALSAITGFITIIAQKKGEGIVELTEFSIYDRFVNSSVAYMMYLKNTIWPSKLSIFYPITEITIPVFLFSLSITGVISFFVIYVSFCKENRFANRYLFSGWFWFLGTLVPVIGIVKIGDFSMADRYTYMAINGLFIILVFFTGRALSLISYKRVWYLLLPIVVLGSLIPHTIAQVRTWKNSRTVLLHALNVIENNYIAHHAMGELLAGEGRIKDAVVHFHQAAMIRPDKAALWIKYGRALAASSENGIWNGIEKPFLKANELVPESPKPYFYLTCIFLAQGDIERGMKNFFLLSHDNSSLKNDNEISQLEILFNKYGLLFNSVNREAGFRVLKNNQETDKETALAMNRVLAKYGFYKSDTMLRQLVAGGYENWIVKYGLRSF